MTSTSHTRRWAVPALAGCVATGTLALAGPALPRLPDHLYYADGFAPAGATVLGAGLAVVPALDLRGAVRLPGRVVALATYAAGLLLLWSAAGIVLDLFRLFFRVTGIPAGDFAVVDWPGLLLRGAGLVTLGLLVAVAESRHRAAGCLRCGRGVQRGPAPAWPAYAAFVLGFPYPLLKLYWSLGGGVLRPDPYLEGFPFGELVVLLGGAVVSLAVVRPWGRALPRWLVLLPAWSATTALLTMGSLATFGTLAQLAGLTDGPVDLASAATVMVAAVYGSWLLFGLALGTATRTYQQRTRPRYGACPR